MGDGRWYLDGVDLSTYAWNVRNRSAGLGTAGFRGDNDVVAARGGEVYRKKPRSTRVQTLSMWAVGCDPDGSMPLTLSRAAHARENLDRLTQVFGRRDLLELARTHDDAVQYGLVNWIPNPSAENAGQKVLVRENVLQNPSMEYTDGDVVLRRNVMLNPRMEDGRRRGNARVNLVRNPRMAYESGVRVRRTNLIANPSFEATLKRWEPSANAVIKRVRARRAGVWPVTGAFSLRITAPTGGSVSADCTGRCTAGLQYTLSAYVRNDGGQSQQYRVSIRWKDAAGALVATTTGTALTLATDTQGRPTATAVAPAGAKSFVARLVVVSAVLAGDKSLWDAVQMETGAVATTYLDGSLAESDGLRYRWVDESDMSRSEEYTASARGWSSPLRTQLSAEHPRRGAQALKVVVAQKDGNGPMASTPAGTVLARQFAANLADVDEGSVYSGSIDLLADPLTTRSVGVRLAAYDSDGTPVSTGVADTTVALDPGAWQTVVIENVTAPAGAVKMGLTVVTQGTWLTTEAVYVQLALVEAGRNAGDWFDGSVRIDDTFEYEWADEPHWSTSSQVSWSVEEWSGVNGTVRRARDGVETTFCAHLEAVRTPAVGEKPAMTAVVEDLVSGRDHTFSVTTRHVRVMTVRVRLVWEDGTTTTGTTVTLAAGQQTRIRATGTCPLGSDKATVFVETLGTPTDGDWMDAEAAMMEPTAALRPWFDGRSGKRFAWLGDEDKSVSVRYADKANGWVGFGSARPSVRRALGLSGEHVAVARAAQNGNCGITAGNDTVDAGTSYAFGIDVRVFVARTVIAGIAWYDRHGVLLSTSTSSTSVAADGAMHRVAVTAAAPATAAVGSPVAYAQAAGPDEEVWFDRGVFGFGTTTTYADGDSGSGWEWVADTKVVVWGHEILVPTPGLSESRRMVAGVDYWTDNANGVTSRSSLWASDRAFSAKFVVTATAAAWFGPVGAGEKSARRFRLRPGPTTFAVTIMAEDDCRITLGLLPSVWNGYGWDASDQADQTSPSTLFSAGDVKRLTFTHEFGGDATHVLPRINVRSTASGNPPAGTTVYADQALLGFDVRIETVAGDAWPLSTHVPTEILVGSGPPPAPFTFDTGLADVYLDEDTGTLYLLTGSAPANVGEAPYVDGEGFWSDWRGEADASPSVVVGPARVAMIEVPNPIDMDSMAGGSRAEFDVEYRVPTVLWRETKTRQADHAIGRAGSTVLLDEFGGSTAPIEDAVYVVYGPISPFTLTDLGGGSWVQYLERVEDDEHVMFDAGDWTVTGNTKHWVHVKGAWGGSWVERTGGHDRMKFMRKSNEPRLLVMEPELDELAPRVRVDAHSIGRGARLVVVGRRAFHQA